MASESCTGTRSFDARPLQRPVRTVSLGRAPLRSNQPSALQACSHERDKGATQSAGIVTTLVESLTPWLDAIGWPDRAPALSAHPRKGRRRHAANPHNRIRSAYTATKVAFALVRAHRKVAVLASSIELVGS